MPHEMISQSRPQLTPEYFIELWKAIHGGDPAPDEALGIVIAGAAVLDSARSVADKKLRAEFAKTIEPVVGRALRLLVGER
jgi:hypothetical protein